MSKNKWFLNGGRGSGQTYRRLFEYYENKVADLKKENAELRAIAENQQSSNMSRYFENKKLKEGLAVGSTLNKGLNSLNKALEEERDKYRNMVFDLQKENAELKAKNKWYSEQVCNKECAEVWGNLTKAKELLKKLYEETRGYMNDQGFDMNVINEVYDFINSEVEK